jgi:short-subunit dehydrogenase
MRYKSKKRVFVITGASAGIGAELARQLARRRHRLVLAARSAEALERVAGECSALGAQVVAVPTDVTIDADCKRLIERAVEAFGGIDVLVNNAGLSMHARFADITDFSTFEQLWRVNCLGTIQCTRYAYRHLRATPSRRGGQIVGISSLAGKTGVPGRTAYCMSKFAQSGFLEALRIEAAADGIRVTVVYPGIVRTDFRRRGLNAHGAPAGASGLDERGAMPVEECARRIIGAIRAHRRELVMTAQGRFGLWLKLIAPGWVDRMARAKLAKTSEQKA